LVKGSGSPGREGSHREVDDNRQKTEERLNPKECCMRPIVWVLLLAVLLPAAAGAQETRGNINGIVQDSGGVVPGAAVRITNTATSQTQQLLTNSGGYFEAVLLNPGT
jgi:hypothetical protein